jgi:hypothetical protein
MTKVQKKLEWTGAKQLNNNNGGPINAEIPLKKHQLDSGRAVFVAHREEVDGDEEAPENEWPEVVYADGQTAVVKTGPFDETKC